MKHGDLFAGIGAFSLAARWMKWKTEFWVENNPFCQKVLRKNFPGTKEYADIRETDFTVHKGLDILTAGFPCQPFSHAGKRKGDQDDRFLWPEVPRAAIESQARFILGENVTGLLTMENGKTLERILSDLEIAGYEVETFVVPAAAVGAWHRRDRVWIFAHHNSYGRITNTELEKDNDSGNEEGMEKGHEPDAIYLPCDDTDDRSQRNERIEPQEILRLRGIQRREDLGVYALIGDGPDLSSPVLCRSYDGISNGMDRVKSLGNAVVPQLAYRFFKAIDEYEKILP